jgi:hypothetical protein
LRYMDKYTITCILFCPSCGYAHMTDLLSRGTVCEDGRPSLKVMIHCCKCLDQLYHKTQPSSQMEAAKNIEHTCVHCGTRSHTTAVPAGGKTPFLRPLRFKQGMVIFGRSGRQSICRCHLLIVEALVLACTLLKLVIFILLTERQRWALPADGACCKGSAHFTGRGCREQDMH